MDQRVANLPLLEATLRFVVHLLEPAAAAALDVRARRGDAIDGLRFHSFAARFAIARSYPVEAGAHAVAGEAAIHPHHSTFVTGKGLAS